MTIVSLNKDDSEKKCTIILDGYKKKTSLDKSVIFHDCLYQYCKGKQRNLDGMLEDENSEDEKFIMNFISQIKINILIPTEIKIVLIV